MRVGIRVGIDVGVAAGIGLSEYVPTTPAALTTGDIVDPVLTNSTAWTAALTWQQPGFVGNGKKLEMLFVADTPSSITVTDNEGFSGGIGTPTPGSVAVLVEGDVGDYPTIGELEAAINAGSALVQVTTPDAAPSKVIDVATLDSAYSIGIFSRGV